MGKVKDKDIQYVYDVISESLHIQNLIKRIANGNELTSASVKTDNSSEIDNLHYQLSQTQSQLHQTNETLEKYKDFYNKAKPKVEKYDSLVYEVASLKNDIEKYQLELSEKVSEIESLKYSISSLENDKNNLSVELESARETIRLLKKQFENPVKYFEMYCALSYTVRSGLENVISDKNEIAFIASCSNENNLSSIWEYIKEISADTESEDFKTLNLIFDYFFDVFNESLTEPKYKRDDVEIGDDFDDDYYDRCNGSTTSGEITKIVLRGYKSRNTGKIIHKSIVKV